MPAKKAIVNADGIILCSFAKSHTGNSGIGSPVGISGNREPIVSTGIWNIATTIEEIMTAIR